MKIVLPGGNGQIGTLLAHALSSDGHQVVVLSRSARPAPWRVVAWDGERLGDWARELEGADAVINLAGRSVNCRYGPANRREILESRLRSTRAVGAAIAQARRPPATWLQASTATIYAHRYDEPNGEASGILGGEEPGAPDSWRFSIDVAKQWERAAVEAAPPGVRQVLMRSAITLVPRAGGAFAILLRLVSWGLGGRQGSGKQYVSWIHDRDFVRAVRWLLEHEELSGAVNVAAPNPLPNGDFMRILRRAWGARVALPASDWMLTAGSALLRTETELVAKSRRVIPERLVASGFDFDFPSWNTAAADLCRRWRETGGRS
jgi:uncharacterized protein (TIGR01777 family)